ncbi:CDP-diacylglycerol--serine O-phosphatidyltransferase [Methanimicrococcus hacksteinii]|nr:CDP-diacylglycerol--serine O-phosphatidyltransferase [Methanimicrococcus sp. At1]
MLHLLKAPDFVSMINLIFGMAAIFFAFSGAFGAAAACLLIAAAADGVDGYVARKTSGGPLGEHIDSLVDVVSFGVAPAVIVYCMSENIISVVFVCFYLICGILRLARYNAMPHKKEEYAGIPITGAAVALSMFVLILFNLEKTNFSIPYDIEIMFVFMFVLSLLMISTIPYSKVMKKETFAVLIILFVGTIASLFVSNALIVIFPAILGFLMLIYLISPLIGLISKKKSVQL